MVVLVAYSDGGHRLSLQMGLHLGGKQHTHFKMHSRLFYEQQVSLNTQRFLPDIIFSKIAVTRCQQQTERATTYCLCSQQEADRKTVRIYLVTSI